MDKNEFIYIKDKLPEKGKDIVAIDSKGNKHFCFRCTCPNTNCTEWRCSITGFAILIDVVSWRYVI
jgi:hypothetical protein